MNRPRVSVYIAMSLDGFIAGPNHELDWLSSVEVEGEDYGYTEFFAGIDTMLMGRRTFDVVSDFSPWPYAEKRCVVLTHRPAESKNGEEYAGGDLANVLSELAGTGSMHVYLDGGQLVRQGLESGVVDAITISVIPVLLGSGVPLFETLSRKVALTLTASQAYESGLVQLTYEPR